MTVRWPPRAWRGPLATLALLAACWAAWEAGGWAMERAGLGELRTLGQAGSVFACLTAAERALARLLPPH